MLEANARDLAGRRSGGLSAAMQDRLRLTTRDRGDRARLREVAALPDPVGEVERMARPPNGLHVGGCASRSA